MNYEDMVLEQEKRTIFGLPIRHTTLLHYPGKFTSKEFVDYIDQFKYICEGLQSREMFIEEWLEAIMAYNEIEPESYTPDLKERCYKNIIIDMYLKEST